MQKEKVAVIALVVIIVCAISAFLVLEYGQDILKNLTGQKTTIELGDCVDVNYIGKYTNSTIFDSSYNDTTNKTGGIPLKIFVSFNDTQMPPSGYEDYYSGIIKGLMEGLIGLKEGDKVTIGPIPPEKAYGVYPKIGDVMNFSSLLGYTAEFKLIEIQENASMPSELEYYFGNGTTTLCTLRDETHYIGEIIDVYPFWENSSVVTKINETMLWMYATPSTVIGENFTYLEVDETTGLITEYPESSSSISFINDTIIEMTHNPEINTTINISQTTQYGLYHRYSYTVESLTADKINASITDSTGNKTYVDFDRTETIQRNRTMNITQPIPAEYLEMLFSSLRSLDSNFKLSYHPLADQTLYFEVKIEKVYKTSQK